MFTVPVKLPLVSVLEKNSVQPATIFILLGKKGSFGLAEGNETPVQGQAPAALAKKTRKITLCR